LEENNTTMTKRQELTTNLIAWLKFISELSEDELKALNLNNFPTPVFTKINRIEEVSLTEIMHEIVILYRRM
jgi:hypothetical protein